MFSFHALSLGLIIKEKNRIVTQEGAEQEKEGGGRRKDTEEAVTVNSSLMICIYRLLYCLISMCACAAIKH